MNYCLRSKYNKWFVVIFEENYNFILVWIVTINFAYMQVFVQFNIFYNKFNNCIVYTVSLLIDWILTILSN